MGNKTFGPARSFLELGEGCGDLTPTWPAPEAGLLLLHGCPEQRVSKDRENHCEINPSLSCLHPRWENLKWEFGEFICISFETWSTEFIKLFVVVVVVPSRNS